MEQFKKLIRQLEFTAQEAITNFIRSGWMSWIVITTMMVSLSVFGGFLMLVKDFNYMAESIGSKVQIVIFLKQDADLAKTEADISRIEGVASTKAISKNEAWQELKSELKDNLELENIQNQNPLPDTIQVTVGEAKDVESVAEKLKSIKEIEEVKYSKELANYIDQLGSLVRMVGIFITVIFGFSTLAIIVNTIRLAVNSRKNEIEIMRLVGATDWFIRMPFLLEGILFGFFSSILTSIALIAWRSFSISQIKAFFPFIPITDDYNMIGDIIAYTVAGSILIGLLGSSFSVARYLTFEKAKKEE